MWHVYHVIVMIDALGDYTFESIIEWCMMEDIVKYV